MIAIDMEMPEGCEDCKFDNKYVSALGTRMRWCGVSHAPIKWETNSRPHYCPLIDMDKYQDDRK